MGSILGLMGGEREIPATSQPRAHAICSTRLPGLPKANSTLLPQSLLLSSSPLSQSTNRGTAAPCYLFRLSLPCDLSSSRRRIVPNHHATTFVPIEQVQIDSWMAGSEDMKGLAESLGELRVEASPSSPSRGSEVARHGNGKVAAAPCDDDDDDIWDDNSDSPGHESSMDREWAYRRNQFLKMGYRDGITEGQKDAAQEGFNIGFRQSVHAGYKWGLVRGITSALASLPDNLKEKLLPDVRCKGKLQDLHCSVQEISAQDALQMFHERLLKNNHQREETCVTSEPDTATDSTRLQTIPKDLVLLLHECPDIKVRVELTQDS